MSLDALRQKLCSTRLLVAFTVLFVASQATIGAILRDVGPMRVLRAQTTFSKTTFLAIVDQWQREGVMPQYMRHFIPDFVHPVWYALFFAALLARGLDRQHLPERWNAVLLLPFLAGAFDLVENCLHLVFLSDLGAVTQPLVALSALASNLKWALLAVSLVLVLGLRPWRPRRA